MKLSSLRIRGFRCFRDEGQTIALDDLTTFVGPNSSGKTAAMMALARLFGDSSTQRRISSSDFHLAPNEKLKDKPTRGLSIECTLTFPELNETAGTIGGAVPETFNQMVVSEPGGTPFCRIRLESTWTDDGTPYGDVEQEMVWILTDSNDPAAINDHKRKMQAVDRARIRVLYVPATRDPENQIRGTTATVFSKLLDSLAWNGVDAEMKQQLEVLQAQLTSLTGIKTLNAHVQESWSKIYLGRVVRNVRFQAVEEDPTALVKLLVAAFQPAEDGRTIVTTDLSDGLRSLFSLSLSLGLFNVEQKIRGAAEEAGFAPGIAEGLPLLTIFAVEEPENHLSPHYLGHVVTQLTQVSTDSGAQVILSSHSPSILSRIQPDNVRYFRGNEHSDATIVTVLPLPQDQTDEAFKYVREAIRGYPEIYFASLVVLGEGPSEEIILKHAFEAHSTPLDAHFISIVPLGGRHVNHFWRLLHGLGVPYLTLLDLDREKDGAGWGRVQYIRNQLVALHGKESPRLDMILPDGTKVSLANSNYDSFTSFSANDIALMDAWLHYLQTAFDVYFSYPLDLDLSLLEAFPHIYRGLVTPPQLGPRMPAVGTPEYFSEVDVRVRQVLTNDLKSAPVTLGNTYSPTQRELFPWYKYLFMDGSKPVTHMRAMISIDKSALATGLPATLKALLARAQSLVKPVDGGAIHVAR